MSGECRWSGAKILQQRNQRGARGVRSSCDSIPFRGFLGGNGRLRQRSLQLKLSLDLATFREVGECNIEIRLISLAVADYALQTHESLVVSEAPRSTTSHISILPEESADWRCCWKTARDSGATSERKGRGAVVQQSPIHVEHLRSKDIGFQNQAATVHPNQSDGCQIKMAEIFLPRFFDLGSAVEQLFILNLQLGFVNMQFRQEPRADFLHAEGLVDWRKAVRACVPLRSSEGIR